MWFISSLPLFSCGFYLYYRWFYVVCKHFFQKNCTIRKTLTQIKPIMLSFSFNYTSEIPEDVDRGWFYFFVTLLNQFYWVASATIGGIIGSLLKFDTSGISFVMTAMFVVIFLDQWMKEKIHVSSMIGILVSLVCLILFGADSFMIPTMILIVLLLTVLRKWLEQCDKLKEKEKPTK